MRFTVSTQALTDSLAWVARSLPARPAVPILAGVKMDVADGRLSLSTFDYEQSAVASVDVDSTEDGTVIVPGRMLSEIARGLPKGDVDVFVENSRLRLQGGRARFALPLMAASEYPALPGLPAGLGTVPADLFAAAVKQVSIAAGRDDSLPALTTMAVQMDPETGVLTLAATDRYRLAVKQIEYTPAEDAEPQTLLAPARALDGYTKVLANTGDVTLGGKAKDVLSVATDGRTGTLRLVDVDFVQYEKVLPTTFNVTATVPTKALADAVKRVSLVADQTTPCRLVFSEDTVTVEAGSTSGEDGEGDEQVDGVVYEGAPMSIAFNFAFLSDGLAAIDTDEVVFCMNEPLKPAVLRPAATDADYTYLIMPVRVKQG